MKKGILNQNQYSLRYVWLHGPNYTTSSTQFRYTPYCISSRGQCTIIVTPRNLVCKMVGINLLTSPIFIFRAGLFLVMNWK